MIPATTIPAVTGQGGKKGCDNTRSHPTTTSPTKPVTLQEATQRALTQVQELARALDSTSAQMAGQKK